MQAIAVFFNDVNLINASRELDNTFGVGLGTTPAFPEVPNDSRESECRRCVER
jgi:hypothetical protein